MPESNLLCHVKKEMQIPKATMSTKKRKKNKALWLILMSSTWTAAQCSCVTLADIATATVWEAEWPSDNRQSLSPDCYSHRLSLLGCPPNLYQDLSWISPIVEACLCVRPPTVCSTVCAPHIPTSPPPRLPPTPSLSGSKLVHLQKIPTTLTLIQLKASGCAKNMSSHCLLHIMIIDRAGLTEARILHTSAVHNWSDNSPWSAGSSNCLQRFR